MVATQDVYDVVRSSPAAVAAHDKAGWIALFDDDYVIEDPVGWQPVRGDAISGFWDAFIAPNDIEFVVHHDWIDGLHVVRDVTVVTTLGTGLQVTTPAHLRYELVEREGALAVQRMAAHWEVLPNVSQLMRPRAAHLRSMAAINASICATWARAQPPASSERSAASARRANGRCGPISAPRVDGLDKVIASGNTVTANCTVDGRPAAVIADQALVRGYRDAMTYVQRRADDGQLRWNRELVVAVQDRVLAGNFANGAGRLRERSAWVTHSVTGAVVFEPPPHEAVPDLVDKMCATTEDAEWLPSRGGRMDSCRACRNPSVPRRRWPDGAGLVVVDRMYRGGFRHPAFTNLEEWWGKNTRD